MRENAQTQQLGQILQLTGCDQGWMLTSYSVANKEYSIFMYASGCEGLSVCESQSLSVCLWTELVWGGG